MKPRVVHVDRSETISQAKADKAVENHILHWCSDPDYACPIPGHTPPIGDEADEPVLHFRTPHGWKDL